LSCVQETADLVFHLIDELMPRVQMSFLFGETPVVCNSRFSRDDLPTVREKAVDMMLASRDPGATLSINDEMVLGIPLPAAQIMPEFPTGVIHVEPGMHYSIVEILEWDQIAFVVKNNCWEIGIQFMFGTHLVAFNSSFASHLVPAALNIARDICGTLGFWEPGLGGSLIEPVEDPYYFLQLFTPPTQVNFTI
jgi:hypothetical protein